MMKAHKKLTKTLTKIKMKPQNLKIKPNSKKY